MSVFVSERNNFGHWSPHGRGHLQQPDYDASDTSLKRATVQGSRTDMAGFPRPGTSPGLGGVPAMPAVAPSATGKVLAVKTLSPLVLEWIDGGNVTKVGTPANNQLGVWTGDGTLEGDANLTWDGDAFVLDSPVGNFNSIFTIKNSGVARVTVRNDGYTIFSGLLSCSAGLTVTGGSVNFSAITLNTSTVRGINGLFLGPEGNNTVRLNRDADYVLSLNSFTNNPHGMRIYGARTDASNYSRLGISATSTAHTLSADLAGTFASDNVDIVLTPANAGKVKSIKTLWAHTGTAIPAGGTAGAGLQLSSTANFGVFFGSGAPSLSAAKGSLYLRSDGSGTTDRAYINTDGGTTWTALATAA